MVTVDPHDGSNVDGQVERFQRELMTALNSVLERTSKHLDPHAPVNSSNIMRTFWKAKIDGLAEKLGTVVDYAASHTRDRLQEHVNAAVTAAVEPAAGAFEIPSPVDLFAEIYLRSRRGFLLDLGTDAWNMVRTELMAGLNDGESIKELRSRVMSVADVAQPRAERIARTEVVGAMNAGSIAQVRASNLDSTKTWLATKDSRTRPAHAEVDGTTVQLDETFLVGGVRMDRPHDPTAPADEVIQCRCTLTFEISDDAVTAAVFGKPDQARDYHGRWGHGNALNGKDAYEHVAQNQGKITDDDVKNSLWEYVADSTDINAKLRRNRSNTLIGKHERNVKKAIDQSGAITDEPLLVHRGIGGVTDVFKTKDPLTLAGKDITDYGFMSTTAHRNVAERFVGKRDSGIMDITVPAGTKVLAVDTALNSVVQGERELLLRNGTKLHVTEVRKDTDGRWVIKAKVT